MGIALKHAGVSVTVTSLTDVFAFGVGAVTQMPGLESFCVCTAIGLGSIYLLQVSWFVAWMSLDEKRVAGGADGILPCIVHTDYKGSGSSDRARLIVEIFSSLLSSTIFKCCVIFLTLGMFAFGLWGSLLIQQKFDPTLLLPSDSYLRDFLSFHDKLYPNNGWTAYIYTSELDHSDLYKFEDLTNQLTELQKYKTHIGDVDSWWSQLKKFSEEKTNFTHWTQFAQEETFPSIFSDFLFSPYGSKFKPNFKFAGELVCNQPAPQITASKFKIDYLIFNGPEEHIPAKHKIEEIVKNSNISGAFSHVEVYAAWETDQIIGYELWRNIGLAMLCVFIVTLILLANIPVCLLVLMIVVFTLTNIIGFLHFWDITIDIISCINLVLAIGLCVDYSVHIGHAFLIAKGSRKARAVQAVATIGPAVFNGGVTTLLALVLLGASTSHVFVTFFKVFVLTVVFGLFHGLVLLPVLLSLIGPVDTPDEQNSDSVGSTSTDISPISTPAITSSGHISRAAASQN
jgi:predicted RND superfamily exporter protein